MRAVIAPSSTDQKLMSAAFHPFNVFPSKILLNPPSPSAATIV
jgi:hypothetical protein